MAKKIHNNFTVFFPCNPLLKTDSVTMQLNLFSMKDPRKQDHCGKKISDLLIIVKSQEVDQATIQFWIVLAKGHGT